MQATFKRRLITVFGFRPSPRRLPVAIKAAITMALPMSVFLLAGHPELMMACGPGAFTVLYGPASPARFRLKLMGSAGLGFVAAAGLGALTAGNVLLGLAAMVLTAVVATLVCAALKVGPPGAYFFPLVVGIAGYQAAHQVPVALIVGGVAVGAAVAVAVGMADLLLDPRGAERAAIAAARKAIAAYQADADARVRASVAPVLPAWTQISELGYLVLGACWHPGLRADSDRFVIADQIVEGLGDAPSPQQVAEVREALGPPEASAG